MRLVGEAAESRGYEHEVSSRAAGDAALELREMRTGERASGMSASAEARRTGEII